MDLIFHPANSFPTRTLPLLFLGLMLSAVCTLAQEVKPVPLENLPPHGTFWSLQRTNCPPWPLYPPYLRELGVPVYFLGYGNAYLLDDASVDYMAIYKEREAERALRRLEWEAGLLNDDEYWALEGGRPAMMMRSLSSSYAYENPVFLTNLVVSLDGSQPMTASFSIAGGTNNVPYDILKSTNAATAISQWDWLGLGYTSNRYTFSNQPLNQAFFILAKPQKTMVVGWGNDVVGQCSVPAGTTNAMMVTGGGGQSLALLNNGTVVAWGQNGYGQGSVPTNLAGVTMIASGWYHNVALLTNGTVTAWGLNTPSIGYTLTNAPADLTNAIVISAQALHSLTLRSNGTVVAWGYNGSGETNVPSGLSNVVAIAAGYQHNLAVKSDGTVVAWGDNGSGQTNVPAGLSNVVDVAAGVAHSVALRKDGSVVAWGRNSYGETNVPVGLTNVVAIAAGGDPYNDSSYSLALKQDNTVISWGSGEVVTPLGGMSNVIAIANGADHALAIRSGPRTPVITLQPTDQYQIGGGNVTFTAKGAGLYGVTYQWKTNGVNLAGATNATLTLSNVQAAQALDYAVTVGNEVGTITSPNAKLYLVTPPVLLSQTPMPTNQGTIFQEPLALSVAATAPGQSSGFPLSYQWKFNGTNINGATSKSYTLLGGASTVGAYNVVVTNAAGSASASWQVTNFTYVGSYVVPGTLAYHLATNAVARTNGYTPGANLVELSGWTWEIYYPTNMHLLTNAVWSTNFWLKDAQGLTATSIGASNNPAGQRSVTMVSPRHYLYATHVGSPETIAFLDTNNVVHWRSTLGRTDLGFDSSVGILNADLPPSIGFLPVVPTNLMNYLPTNATSFVQGIGMNQDMSLFSQPMMFGYPPSVGWDSSKVIPYGLGTNWSLATRDGDSSAPARLLIGNQLVLLSHNYSGGVAGSGPNYAFQFNSINEKMHYLSTNNNAGTDYQLIPFSLTNWPAIH